MSPTAPGDGFSKYHPNLRQDTSMYLHHKDGTPAHLNPQEVARALGVEDLVVLE